MALQSCPASQFNVSSSKASYVPAGLYLASRVISGTAGVWKSLGNLESRLLGAELDQQAIVKPIFVCGLARSGSTILTEIINRHPRTTSHRYSDFPLTWTPYWWNSLRARLPLPNREPEERAHRDRLLITPDSPEAIEEVVWMHFFPDAHRPDRGHVIAEQDSRPEFERHYRDHIRKLLIVRKRPRYLAKNNYHVTRLEYLLKLFPDARFVIPIREPLQHVASLIKQHRLFTEHNAQDARVSRQLQMAGHYEFGPHRCPILVHKQQQSFYDSCSDDVAWYAQQWADVYGFLHQHMQANAALNDACAVMRYEDMCNDARTGLQRLFAHLRLGESESAAVIEACAPIISAPDYYQPDFTAADVDRIRNVTASVAANFGYPGD